jgi:YfiH family protein
LTAADSSRIDVLRPEWSVPSCVRATFSLRAGGVSAAPFDSLNISARVGDLPFAVTENRRRLSHSLSLPTEPLWLEQVHGTAVLEVGAADPPVSGRTADAVITRLPGRVCVIQVADCLPVLLAASDGSVVAAVHAGWRGLAAGVLEAAVTAMRVAPQRLLAWLGPAIGREHFEVGDDVCSAFLAPDPGAALAFRANARGRWQCDLAGLARRRLAAAGVPATFGGGWCTYADAERFFSYRRDGRCGRMAALIWLS